MLRGLNKRHCFLLLRFMKMFLSWHVWDCAHMCTGITARFKSRPWLGCKLFALDPGRLLPAAAWGSKEMGNTPTSQFLDRTSFTWRRERSSRSELWTADGRYLTVRDIFTVVSFCDRAEELVEKKNHFGILKRVSSTEPVCSWSVQTKTIQWQPAFSPINQEPECPHPKLSAQWVLLKSLSILPEPERQTPTCMQTAYFHPKLTPGLETARLTSCTKALKSGREFGATGYKDHRLN